MSVVDICNRALSEIGTQGSGVITSLNEASAEAVQCALWYDNQRRGLLRSAPWGFARRQLALSLLGDYADGTSPYPFLYKYAYPADCLKLRYILWPPQQPVGSITPPAVGVGPVGPTFLTPSRKNRWLINNDVDPTTGFMTKTIISNVPNAVAVYTCDITNTDLFDELFESALTASLAYKVVIPLTGNVGMREQFRQAAEGSINNARVADGNEGTPSTDSIPDWIQTRGITSAFGYAGLSGEWGNWFGGWDNMSWGM